jgi:hypothetical protein
MDAIGFMRPRFHDIWRGVKAIKGMGRGGARPGAGRKPGTATRRTREIAERAMIEGETPLEYMLRVMRDPAVDHERRDEMARAAAPYIHPRLTAVAVKGLPGELAQSAASGDDLTRLIAPFRSALRLPMIDGVVADTDGDGNGEVH